ncbi:hypothetical protein J0H58_00925 [bacterium]|nr:hypothetical protein [bacterium]
MFEVYFWDTYTGRFRVHAEFPHRGAAEAVAGRMTAASGTVYFVRFQAA